MAEKTVLYMAMSLDGFITGPDDSETSPAGTGGMRLMEWLGGGGSDVGTTGRAAPQQRPLLDPTSRSAPPRRAATTTRTSRCWGPVLHLRYHIEHP
jgi:hypothetical protein